MACDVASPVADRKDHGYTTWEDPPRNCRALMTGYWAAVASDLTKGIYAI